MGYRNVNSNGCTTYHRQRIGGRYAAKLFKVWQMLWPSSGVDMKKFKVEIQTTVTHTYYVVAKDWEEAEDIAYSGNLPPAYSKEYDGPIDSEEVEDYGFV